MPVLKTVNLRTPKGRWKWASEVSRRLGHLAYRQPPYQPQVLADTTPQRVKRDIGIDDNKHLLIAWQGWISESIETRHQNELRLRTLLRCWGVVQEALNLASQKNSGKPEIVKDLLNLIEGFFLSSWNLSPEDIEARQGNVDKAARIFAYADSKQFMDPEWGCIQTVRTDQ